MEKHLTNKTLTQVQKLTSRALMGVLGVGFLVFLLWQINVVFTAEDTATVTATQTNATDVARNNYTELFALMHRADIEGNILAEATWYTPELTQLLFAYTQPSSFQRDLSRLLARLENEDVLTFSVLLTTETADVSNVAVADYASVTDDLGRTYPVLGWERISPLTLRPDEGQTQETGVLIVSSVADDGTSVWSNGGETIQLLLDGVEEVRKGFSWQKSLALNVTYF
ncbi:MAG: hypothetical protein WCV86_00625 [Patescibacteria group bacterium]|jgi:hypothetical protein